MLRAARLGILSLFCLMAGGMMLASGETPLSIVLVLSGVATLVLGISGVLLRGRLKAGMPENIALCLEDVTRLRRSDWIQLVVYVGIGIGFMIAGFASLRNVV